MAFPCAGSRASFWPLSLEGKQGACPPLCKDNIKKFVVCPGEEGAVHGRPRGDTEVKAREEGEGLHGGLRRKLFPG